VDSVCALGPTGQALCGSVFLVPAHAASLLLVCKHKHESLSAARACMPALPRKPSEIQNLQGIIGAPYKLM